MATQHTRPARPRVVIVGGGFAGLEAARALRKAPVDVTLIDRSNHHLFQPLLYQAATAELSPAEIAWPIRSILRNQVNATVLMAEVDGVDLDARLVRAGRLEVPFDELVIATGATHSYFGHDEWAKHAPGLKRIEDATRIRRALLLAFERAEISTDEAQRRALLTFVVVGGGPTGVELAGAMADVARNALRDEFRRIDPRSARILLIEAGPRILPQLPDDLSAYAQASLERLGVEVHVSTRVTNCDASGVDCEPLGRIDAATRVWAAGVVASPAARWLGVAADRAGRVRVTSRLYLPDDPNVFVIGDTALAVDDEGKAAPGVAPAAKQMGRYVGKLIAARAGGAQEPPPFHYRHHGDLATIGRNSAVVKLDSVKLRGFPAWLFWSLAHVYYLIGARNRFIVATSWAWTYFTRGRGVRLITRTADTDERPDESAISTAAAREGASSPVSPQ